MTQLKTITRAVTAGTALLIGSSLTHAAVLEETVVTAAKREQSMQDEVFLLPPSAATR